MSISMITPEKTDKICEIVMKTFLVEDASIGIGSGPIIDKIVEELKSRASEVKSKRIQVHCTKSDTRLELVSLGIPAFCSADENEVPMVDFYVETANHIINMSKTSKPNYQIFIRTDPICKYSWVMAKKARSVQFVVNGDHAVTKTVRGIPMEIANTVDGRAFYKSWSAKMGGMTALRRNFDASPDRYYAEWAPEPIDAIAERAKTIHDWRAIQQDLNTIPCVLSHNLYCGSNCSLLEPVVEKTRRSYRK